MTYSDNDWTDQMMDPARPHVTSHASEVADLFLARFGPKSPMADDAFKQRITLLRERAGSVIDHSTLLLKMLDVVEHTLRTSVHFPDRWVWRCVWILA